MSSKSQGVNDFTPFKKFEYILKSKIEPFPKKIESLIEIWKSLGQCNQENSDIGYIVQIMDWAKLHTLNIVLTGKWKMFKGDFEAKLLSEVEKTQNELMKISDVFSKKFQKLADVIKNPWDDPVLANLLHDSNAAIGQDEIEFFCVETAYLVSVRLKKLCESQCEDLALNLVTAFMNCYNLSQTQNFSLNATKTHILFCFDIHVALLYRYNRRSEIVALFKKLSLEEGLHLIRRFAKKRVKISKVWRNYPEITFLASQVFVTAAVTKPIEESGEVLKQLLDSWIAFSIEHSMVEKVEVSVRRIIQAATAAQHIYICCEIIHDKFGLKLRTFTIELYIRALTTDMNNLESQKTENETEKVEETTKRLANGFSNLADILKDNVQVSRECALTAFSLEPTLDRLRKIEELAKLSGFNVLDTGQIWECKLHPPVTTADEISWICNACGKWMCKPNLDLRLTTNFALNEALNFEQLGISSQLCDDLAVVLNGPRYHLLSWLLRWEDLHRLCEMYLNDMERTKNLVTELKFVDIDYSMFEGVKREPVDELAGIERGYERFLYADEKFVDMIENCNPEPPPEVPQAKSDPNTLKSLRMFRHNIKRNKPQVSQNILESNNLANSSQNLHREHNWFSDPRFDQNLSFNPPNPFQPNGSPSHNTTSRSYSEVFFNHLTSNTQFKRSADGAVDFSKSTGGNKQSRDVLDFRSNIKRKPSDNDFDDYQKFVNNYNSPSDNFLHNVISYEFARMAATEPKRHQPTDFHHQKPNLVTTPNVPFQTDTLNLTNKRTQAKNERSDKILPQPSGLRHDVTPQNSNQYERSPSQTKNFLLSSMSYKYKEDVALSPSKGFPSFDKIPAPTTTDKADKSLHIEVLGNNLEPPKSTSDESNNKRTNTEEIKVVPEKKPKSDELTSSPKNGSTPILEKELSKHKIIIELLSKNGWLPKNGNSLPSNNAETLENDKNNVEPARPKNAAQPETNERKMLLKLSEQHPMIITKGDENSSNETKSDINEETVVKIDDCQEESSKDCQSETETKNDYPYKYKEKPKWTNHKELKIILHRLSDEMIKSFIPSYSENCNNCNYTNKKRHVGRPRKVMCCKYRIKNSNFDRLTTYDKYSPRTVRRHNSDRLKRIRSRNMQRERRTGHKNLKKYSNHRHDRAKKPKKHADKDKKKHNIARNNMNPRVVLERLPLDTNYVRSVLSNVPGLNDYEMIRPTNVNHIVNVVQISGGRSTSTGPVQNTQTSTQITPHIQRIGQPRSDKPEHNSNSEPTTTATPASTSANKPTTSQPSTLINILSQQIIRPGQSNCIRNRSSPLINILSQQIIRPATTQSNKLTTQSEGQANTPKTESNLEETKTVTTTTKTTTNTTSSGQGTILQFICKSSLPKFQQAFGKSVYQNNTETSEASSTSTETVTNAETNKKTPTTKNSSVNIQPIQGGVIYTRQMPVGQTINLIPPGRGQVFRIATSNSDQISLVKDTVIHSKMSALLAAALQGKAKDGQSDGESTNEETVGRVTVTRPTLVQNARIVKPVLQIPSNVIRTSPQSNLSSTTLEQLREFDMVYKQIKERSSTTTPSEPNTSEPNETPQKISVTYLNQGQKYTQLSPVVVVSSYCNLQPAASPALSVTSQGSSSPCVTPAPAPSIPKVSSKSSKGKTVKNTTTQASKASPIPKPQQKPQEDEHTTQRIFDILAEYAEQLRNSPDLNNKPAPRRRSNPPTNPNQNSKRKKNSGSKKSGQCSSMVSEADIEDHRTVGSEDSSCGVVQISMQEEEQSHVQTVTTESNDSSSGSRQQLILTDAGNNQTRNLIIADSSVGEALKMPNTAVLVPGNYIMPVSMVKGGQQIAVVSGGSKILATVPARSGPNMLLFQSFLNQNRNKTAVPTVKYSTIQPISGISSQSLAGVSGQPPVILPPNSHNLTAVTLGQPLTLKKIDESDRVNTELLLTISQPKDNANSSTESGSHPDSTNSITSTVGNIELEETIVQDNSSEKVFHTYQKSATAPIATPVIAQTSCVKEDLATSEQNTTQEAITMNMAPAENNKSEPGKALERVQSVLVTACTSNGPMLSHTPPRYRKASESAGTNNEPSNKEEFLHNGEKQNNNEQKQFQGNATYFQNKTKKANNPQRLDREMHQLCLQRKQAALERELRLQKSLSEECEDLGVDEPSTSDLFPEADILFDANHSPSFDQSSQDLVKRASGQEKEENKSGMTLFSDDDNSGSLRTDFLFDSVEYQQTETELEYEQNQQLTNGQSSASNESGSSCEDHTLLQNCASMSDVTLNSPVSPDPYHENTPPSLNKYKFKYSNRRKGERNKNSETWTVEVSSSEDTTGSIDLGKSSSHSPESCINKHSHSVSCDEELSDGGYKVVRVAISKNDLIKDEESCEELHCEDDLDCSPSGRGARRSVKKMCSCCNGSQDGGASRKRPASRPHTPAPHKKAFLNKKR
ncbi:uncharacterized protein LOC103314818 isoform X2 [Tribolium castaneum]|uniref:Zinc finger protein Rlf/292/654 TPR repeats domain-containing protein n=1 Tax=Tribolium castaneum TaxID=7070 RepID=D6W6M6_TRICA|nr:PREDICTED: uncharacterized protein LOC103314818 isoform X2 [Tribolium castaneum]EFA10971.2 hypothetical protein TcasGA2_TC004133 [Tribolium castaneum]|eukprot:XP_008200017.1 PREDICTED: uncharacterized protein LOC103314818 isoform X2 [Tribolium castaneum]